MIQRLVIIILFHKIDFVNTTRPGCAFVVFPSRKVGQHVGRPTVSHLVVVDKNEYGTFSKYIKNS